MIGGTVAATTQIGQNIKNDLNVKQIRKVHGFARNQAPPGTAPNKLAGDLDNKGLQQLFDSEVVTVTPIERKLAAPGGKVASLAGIDHKAVLVRTKDGGLWVIESGENYGKYSDTIIKNANNLGAKMEWKTGTEYAVGKGTKV